MRIYIAGPSGSGKTYLSQRLAKQLSTPNIDVDDLWLSHGGRRFYHKPSWYQREAQNQLRDKVSEDIQRAMQAPAWIIDSNYDFVGPIVAASADLVVVLDLPLQDIIKNTWQRHRAGDKHRQGYTTNDFWLYLPTSILKYRAKRDVALKSATQAKKAAILKSQAQISAFIESMALDH